MTLKEMLGLKGPEDETPETEEPEVEAPVEPVATPQYATVEQMQEMISGVSSQLQENFVNLVRGGQQPQASVEPQFNAPSLDEIAEAYEEGDTRKAVQLQAQREAALEQKFAHQLSQVYNEGRSWVSGVNTQLAETSVPDFKKYRKEVAKKMDELGIPEASRSNPQVIELVTNAIKGSRIDEIIAERAEAQKRQENEAPASIPTGRRGNPLNAEPEEVLSADALRVLNGMGMDKESFAKARGVESWAKYQENIEAYAEYQYNPRTYVPKWKRKKQ